jgi:hypothetical protein
VVWGARVVGKQRGTSTSAYLAEGRRLPRYTKERPIRIKADLEAYSQSSHTYVISNWPCEDDSTVTNSLNGYISGASNFLANESAQVRCMAELRHKSGLRRIFGADKILPQIVRYLSERPPLGALNLQYRNLSYQ